LEYYYDAQFLFINMYTILFYFVTDSLVSFCPCLYTLQLNMSHL